MANWRGNVEGFQHKKGRVQLPLFGYRHEGRIVHKFRHCGIKCPFTFICRVQEQDFAL